MRNTLALLSWAIQGLAHADRSRRERIAGIRPPLTGADAMHVYLKEHGIDVPHIDKVIKGLMQDGKTAGAVKELVTITADAAANPHDLGTFVQHLARCCAPTGSEPPTPAVGLVSPSAAPPGTSWTPTAGKQPQFRPEFTSEARQRPPAAPTTDVPTGTARPRFRPEFTSEARRRSPAPAPTTAGYAATTATTAANDAGPAGNLISADCATTPNDAAAVTGCNDPIPDALRPEELARLEALERRVDTFEARIARDLLELKDWMNAQFQELARRIEAQGFRQARMQTELDELRAQLRRVESELRTLTRPHAAPAESPPVCVAAPRDVAVDGEPTIQDAGEAQAPGTKQHGEELTSSDASAIEVPEVVEAAQHEESHTERPTDAQVRCARAEGAQEERQRIAQQRELADPAASALRKHDTIHANEPPLAPLQHEVPVEVVRTRGASPEPRVVADPRSLDERLEAADARIEAGLRVVAELKGNVAQRVGELFQKLEKNQASPTTTVMVNTRPSDA
ncbi:hypothetical protein [Nannocystis pusilla]|uniref:hypothetical protein n=1 Tax=Nannocystis pusilla TaxID=889268 RepID=UPI003B81254C